MTNSQKEMREACHLLAEHIMRQKTNRNSAKWLKEQMLEILLKEDNIKELAADYAEEYDYAEVQNPYLVEVLKAYDAE
jgi:hypothetical protein